MEQKEFTKKLVESFMKLINKADLDKIIYGESYWEFTDRKIEVLDPKKVKLTINKKGKTSPEKFEICSERLTKHKLYGKSILNEKEVKNGRRK